MSIKDFESAIAWWQKQNADYEIVKTARTEFTNGFCEVFWEHDGEHGRDRIRKKGREYILEVIE